MKRLLLLSLFLSGCAHNVDGYAYHPIPFTHSWWYKRECNLWKNQLEEKLARKY